MQKNSKFGSKRGQKDVIIAETRQKPCISQAIFVKLSGISRPLLTLAEGRAATASGMLSLWRAGDRNTG